MLNIYSSKYNDAHKKIDGFIQCDSRNAKKMIFGWIFCLFVGSFVSLFFIVVLFFFHF